MKTYITNTIKLLSAFAIFNLTAACESLIEVDLPDDKIIREEVYQDISTTKAALNYLYSRLKNSTFLSTTSTGPAYNLSLYTDELDYIGNSTNLFYTNNILANNLIVTNWWNNAYKDIYSINSFIEGVTNSNQIDDTNKNIFLGEALTLRALYYQNLTQLFGDIPYTQSTDYNFNATVKKSSSVSVLGHIEADLQSAYELLKYDYRSSDRGYINKAVVELILAYNYLLLEKYDQAEYYCKNLLSLDLYDLEDNIDNVFKKNAKSTLLQIIPGINTNPTPEAALYLFKSITNNSTTITSNLLNIFTTTDLRRQNWIKQIEINNQIIYQPYKYKNNVNNTDEYSILYRLEEVYFLLSESLAKQNKVEEGIEVLNIIKSKRGLTNIPLHLDQEALIQELINESFKEFFTEKSQRFYTLKRNNKIQILGITKPNWESFHSLFPIPETEILINNNLLPNNKGY